MATFDITDKQGRTLSFESKTDVPPNADQIRFAFGQIDRETVPAESEEEIGAQDTINKSIFKTQRERFNNQLSKLGELDKDEKTSFGGIARQFAIGAVNSALIDTPQLFAGEEGFAQLRSEAKIERIARGVGTTVGFLVGGPATLFKVGAKGAGKLFTRFGAKSIRKAATRKVALEATRAGGGLASFEATRTGINRAIGADKNTVAEDVITVGASAVLGSCFG